MVARLHCGSRVLSCLGPSDHSRQGIVAIPHRGLCSCTVHKADRIRNACLAGTLLFPTVVHGIVLSAVNVDAPSSSPKTYFYGMGSYTIFLWIGLILAGE
ncbi:conserved hypothetical protein [Histoplasma capsulatum var. duboisii H88]|uniref:Uncharacterized protein n=2 Tax=Ajellomyces capsulatus TaxID=5037 RepID=F0U6L1_AJEC8|nr:conserved hypothetical protein [Histoplasma capsulatum H143]EGC40650.1 conserved hypothetical protein [Histoplasma capsulatum var. duboisii H88]